jgi:MFS transporter, NNP family, nitrate/nitrite transporter
VLLGALLRIVTGMLADRYVGRVVFSLLLIVVAVPEYLVPMVSSYKLLLYVAFFLGMAGSSFAVGVGFVSHWEFMGWRISVSRLRSSWHRFWL